MKKYWSFLCVLLALTFYLLSLSLKFYETTVNSPTEIAKKVTAITHQKEKRTQELLNKYFSEESLDSLQLKNHSDFETIFNKEGIGLFAYRNDSLLFWSTSQVPLPLKLNANTRNFRPFIRLGNGWYVVNQKMVGRYNYIGLILIKYEYLYQNKYLNNVFQSDFKVTNENVIGVESPNKIPLIRSSKGLPLFSLSYYYLSPYVGWVNNLKVCLLGLAIIFALLLFYNQLKSITFFLKNPFYLHWLIIVVVGLGRFLMLWFKFPSAFYDQPFFQNDKNSILFSSPGDLLLNAMILFYLAVVIKNKAYKIHIPNWLSPELRKWVAILFWIMCLFAFAGIGELISQLIENSRINFDLNNLASLNWLGISSFIAVFVYLVSYYLFTEQAYLYLKQNVATGLFYWVLGTYLLFLLFSYFYVNSNFWLDFIFPCLIVVLIFIIHFKGSANYSFTNLFLFVICISAYFSESINYNTNIKENKYRIILAEKLAPEIDPIAEDLYKTIEEKISFDTNLVKVSSLALEKNPNHYDTKKIIQQVYFNGYWDKYDLDVFIYNLSGEPIYESKPNTSNDISIFENLIKKNGKRTKSNDLHYIKNRPGKVQYLSRFNIKKIVGKNYRVVAHGYLNFESKPLRNEIGFPELLLNRNSTDQADLETYSYAKYRNYVLLTRYGEYAYPLTSAGYTLANKQNYFVDKENYNHFITNLPDNTQLIISKKKGKEYSAITAFSILLLFYGFLLAFVYGMYRYFGSFRISDITLKGRIQIQLLSILLVSFLFLGYGTIRTIGIQFTEKNISILTEKTHVVVSSIEETVAADKNLNAVSKEYLSYFLSKISKNHDADINLYDKNGWLVASSRPQLNQQGIIGSRMNASALFGLRYQNQTELINEEQIGSLKYTSSYIPLKNNQEKLLGYINLPYFAKQNELDNEISQFLITLLNIYLFLFVIALVAAILLSNRITQPLQLVREKISSVQLGKKNELIEWKGKDEIGSLVAEYNRMVVELMNSAEQLAKSEREDAWKEMAKQVAHEIKNPLTPMKLAVQLLYRSFNDKAPDFEKRVERFSQTMIEQIDTLSNIATEFSNFAKMPEPQNDLCNLVPIISNAIALYKDTAKVTIEKQIEPSEAIIVGDKDHLLRILNNLIKNAIQSIDPHKMGNIMIRLDVKDDHFILAITDNGCGIDDNIKSKIFSPSFTTKTTGMGLGLAMVKTMVQNMDGKIWFETKKDVGTTFFIELKMAPL